MQEKLKELLNNAYAPYSNYKVSAVLVCNDGPEFGGVNIENASYSGTVCAERVAIYSAIAKGYRKDDFQELHVMASSEIIVSPCFICRQVFVELLNDDVIVYLYNVDGDVQKYKVKDLCPLPFNNDNLGSDK